MALPPLRILLLPAVADLSPCKLGNNSERPPCAFPAAPAPTQGNRLPKWLAAQPGNWSTLNPATGAICARPRCRAFFIIECASVGAQPLQPDAAGNIGCGNGSGSNNIGNWNRDGSNNRWVGQVA